MAKIFLGVIIAFVGALLNGAFGLKTYAQTQAALHTVNGGGMDYQVYKSIATTGDYGTYLVILSVILILWGFAGIIWKKDTTETN